MSDQNRDTVHSKEKNTLFHQLQEEFEQWRSKNPKNKRTLIPMPLRQAVVKAIDKGMPTSKLQALRISSSQLKSWRKQGIGTTESVPDFVAVELLEEHDNNPPQTLIPTCVLNIYYPHGVRVEIASCDITLATHLLKQFS